MASFCKYGNLQKITSLDGIPSTNYIYAVVNGNNVLQIGKSGPKNKGRLKLVFKGSILGKHNKAFICGIYPHISGKNNEYYAISLNEGADKSKVEQLIHGDMGITTNVQAATFIDDLTNKGLLNFMSFYGISSGKLTAISRWIQQRNKWRLNYLSWSHMERLK